MTVRWSFRCDQDGVTSAHVTADDLVHALELIADAGWLVRGDRQVCPRCVRHLALTS